MPVMALPPPRPVSVAPGGRKTWALTDAAKLKAIRLMEISVIVFFGMAITSLAARAVDALGFGAF